MGVTSFPDPNIKIHGFLQSGRQRAGVDMSRLSWPGFEIETYRAGRLTAGAMLETC